MKIGNYAKKWHEFGLVAIRNRRLNSRTMSFSLHPRLAAGSYLIGIRDGCHVILKDNACFPWLLVVPEVDEGIEDLHQLEVARFEEVMALVRRVSVFVSEYFEVKKLNVGCIGNMVRQMHIHVVGRREDDVAWPGTVWASDAKAPWGSEEAERICAAARDALIIAKPRL